MGLLTLQPPHNFIVPPKHYSGQKVHSKKHDYEA